MNVLRADGLKRSINVALRRYLLMLGAPMPPERSVSSATVGSYAPFVAALSSSAVLSSFAPLVRQRYRRAVRRVQLRDIGIPRVCATARFRAR